MLTMADMSSRTGPMADEPKKKNWVKKAPAKERRGAFKKKVEAAGDKVGIPENLSASPGKRKKKSPIYDHPRSRKD